MRQKRAKTYRKLMSLYSLSFGFREPYQILVDSEICRTTVAAKVDLQHQLSMVLQGEVKPMITQCCIHELYLQGKSQQAVVDLAKSFERRKCNHRDAMLGEECIASVVGKLLSFAIDACSLDAFAGDSNKYHYVIATQSQTLRVKLRLIPAVPIVHINRAVMILEPPSDVTLKAKQQNEEKAFQPSMAELAAIRADTPVEPPRRRRTARGPNPLSMKKKVVHPTRQPMSTPRASGKVSNADSVVVTQKRKIVDVQDDTTVPAARQRKRRRRHHNTGETVNDLV